MKFLKLIAYIGVFCGVVSCATNNSRVGVKNGDVTVSGGSYENESWDNDMEFKRKSWFSDVSMSYDVLLYQIKPDSSFIKWFESNRTIVSRCEELYITLLYTHGLNGQISMLKKELEKSGAEVISIPNFSRHLSMHSAFNDWNLSYHRVYGVCAKKNQVFKVSVPGFKSQTFK